MLFNGKSVCELTGVFEDNELVECMYVPALCDHHCRLLYVADRELAVLRPGSSRQTCPWNSCMEITFVCSLQ